MNEEIYFRHSEKNNGLLLKYPEERLYIKTVKPRLFNSLHTFLWSIETLWGGTYVESQLWRDNKLVSKAEVVSRIPQFPFMPKTACMLDLV